MIILICNNIDNFIKFHEREMRKHSEQTCIRHCPKGNPQTAIYNMKCSGDNVILRGIVHVVSGFPLHFMFYRGNFDCFSNRGGCKHSCITDATKDRVGLGEIQ